jgi:uncharacterized LabA/DUF88 family protein
MPNYAFIDSQNLIASIKSEGWKIDFAKFRTYLKEKYSVGKAYLFAGFIESQRQMYKALEKDGFEMVFKPTSVNYYSKLKGSIEVELALKVMIELNRFRKAIIVSGDGDNYCLIDHLRKIGKLEKVLVPNKLSYSKLINSYAAGKLDFMNNLKTKLEFNDYKTM